MKYLAWDIGIKNLSYCMMDGDYKVLFPNQKLFVGILRSYIKTYLLL